MKSTKLIVKNLRDYYGRQLGLRDVNRRIKKRLKLDWEQKCLRKLSEYIDIKNKTLLDVGTGWGGTLMLAEKMGAKATGVEPDKDLVEITKQRKKDFRLKYKIYEGVGEKLKFKDNSFDIVTSLAVLEHTKKPNKVINEMIRVLKPGGYCYIACPNYCFPRENHYKIFFIPSCPKWLAKIHLSIIGRPTKFIEHLKYVNPYKIIRQLKKHKVKIYNIAEQKMLGNGFFFYPEEVKSKKVKLILNMIKSSRIDKLYGFFAKYIKIYPSTMILVKKK